MTGATVAVVVNVPVVTAARWQALRQKFAPTGLDTIYVDGEDGPASKGELDDLFEIQLALLGGVAHDVDGEGNREGEG